MSTLQRFTCRTMLVLGCAAGLACVTVQDRYPTGTTEQYKACERLSYILKEARASAEKAACAKCSQDWNDTIEITESLEDKISELRRSGLLRGAYRKRLRSATAADFTDELRARCGLDNVGYVQTNFKCQDPRAKCEETLAAEKKETEASALDCTQTPADPKRKPAEAPALDCSQNPADPKCKPAEPAKPAAKPPT